MRHLSEALPEGRVVRTVRERQWIVPVGDAVDPRDIGDDADELCQRHDVPCKRVHICAIWRGPGGHRQHLGDIGYELESGYASVLDLIVLSTYGCFDREGRLCGDTLVPQRSEHRIGPDPDARNVIVLPVDACRVLVRHLEDAVQRLGQPRCVWWEDRIRVVPRMPVDSEAACVRQMGDPVVLHRFEHVDGADDVHGCPERWVGATERDLEGGEVDDVGAAFHGIPYLVAIGDVSGDPLDRRHVAGGDDLLEAPVVRREIEDRNMCAIVEEQLRCPCADAAHRTGDEEPFVIDFRVLLGRGGERSSDLYAASFLSESTPR